MLLEGNKGLVLNVVNKNSIGWAIAETAAFHGAKVGVGAQNDRMMDGVRKLIGERTDVFTPIQVDFTDDRQLESLAEQVKETYGTIDFVVHSAAFANRRFCPRPGHLRLFPSRAVPSFGAGHQ